MKYLRKWVSQDRVSVKAEENVFEMNLRIDDFLFTKM